MHLLISHAAPPGPQCQAALADLSLPRLAELLGLLTAQEPVAGSPATLTPLCERTRAQCLGLGGGDGLIAWAAADAEQLGLTRLHGKAGWAWVTPCHWEPQANHVAMGHPEDLDLSVQECEALRAVLQPYFASEGIQLHPLARGTWLAQGDMFKDLPTASLERVSGASVDAWLPRQAQARSLRKLQSEMEMLLHTHAANALRAARGAPTVNAFWVSGTGTPAAGAASSVQPVRVDESLKPLARHDNPTAWLKAWRALDAGPITELAQRAKAGQPAALTLCGERQALRWELQQQPWWNRLQNRMVSAVPQQLLGTL